MTYANLVHSRHYRAHWFQTFQTYFEFFLQLKIPSCFEGEVHSRNGVFFEIANRKITLS